MKKFLLIIIIFSYPLYSQILIERSRIFNPFFNEENKLPINKSQWINSIGGWGEFGNYSLKSDNEHEWYQKLGIFMELYRAGENFNFSLVSNIEFIADGNNDINFNPRAIFWEEGLLFTKKLNNNYLQVGYYHRCKHDIDNLEYGTERSLIYGSLKIKYLFTLKPIPHVNSIVALKSDIYTIKQDLRKPVNFNVPNIENLSSSLGFIFNNKIALSEMIGVYLHTYGTINFFSNKKGFVKQFSKINSALFNGGIETGIFIYRNAYFCFNVKYEYLSDAAINIYPKVANLVSLGLSIIPREIF